MKRTVLPIALAIFTVIAAAWYMHRVKQQRALDSGDVYVRDQSANADSAAPANPSGSPAAATQGIATNTAPSTPGSATQPMTQPQGAVAIPVSDTIPRNPPGGMAFAGTGKYQLYRQGDITWRLNTDTGQACIIFATDTQWSKSRVYAHGCGAS